MLLSLFDGWEGLQAVEQAPYQVSIQTSVGVGKNKGFCIRRAWVPIAIPTLSKLVMMVLFKLCGFNFPHFENGEMLITNIIIQ